MFVWVFGVKLSVLKCIKGRFDFLNLFNRDDNKYSLCWDKNDYVCI